MLISLLGFTRDGQWMQISSFVNNQDPLSLTGLLKKQLRTPLGLEKSSRKNLELWSSDVSCVPTTKSARDVCNENISMSLQVL